MNEPLNKRVFVVRNGAGAFKTASGWGALREANFLENIGMLDQAMCLRGVKP